MIHTFLKVKENMIGKFKQMENISREMETIVKKQIEILELKVQYLKRTIHWKGLQ